MSGGISIAQLYQRLDARLQLAWWHGQEGASLRQLTRDGDADPCSPLAGHFNPIRPYPIQLLGEVELAWLDSLATARRAAVLDELFGPLTTLVIVAGARTPPEDVQRLAAMRGCPLLYTPLSSTRLLNHLSHLLAHALAPRTTLHGVFMAVLGIGVLITGDSGTGKSELALELISRGHRLVADDAPEFARIAPDTLEGRCPTVLQDFLEARGLGLLNIRSMFGENAIKQRKYLRLIVNLRDPQNQVMNADERLAGMHRQREILGVAIPEVDLPVASGRNLAVLVETAVRLHNLRNHDQEDALHDFMQRQEAFMAGQPPESPT